MELQTLGDAELKKLAFTHVVQSIKRMNLKHKDEAKNRALQNVIFNMLQVCKYFFSILWFLYRILFCACLVYRLVSMENLLFWQLNFD